MSSNRKVYLIDGSGYIFRAYYAVRPLSTKAGIPTNAVVGFARMIAKLLRQEEPEFLGMVFDSPQKTFRHDIYDLYKANRDAPPEDLIPQFQLIRDLTEAMDIPVLAAPGFEADDIIATLADKATQSGFEVIVVSADKDLMQLVGPKVALFDPMKGKLYQRDDVLEKFGVEPQLVADALALAGDTSDNIPGVPKVGPKSAAKLIQEFGDIEQVIKGVATIEKPKAFQRSVIENSELARLSKRLTVLSYEAPVELNQSELAYTAPNPTKLIPFLEKIEARALLRDFRLSVQPEQAERASSTNPSPKEQDALPTEHPNYPSMGKIDRSQYKTILKTTELEKLLELIAEKKCFAFDLETTSLDAHRAEIVGFALAIENDTSYYIPVDHRYLGMPQQLPRQHVLDSLRPFLEDPAILKIGQNLKYDFNVLHHAGIRARGVGHDTMLMAYCIDSSKSSYSLDSLSNEYLDHQTVSYKDVTGAGKNKISFDQVTIEAATEYAGEDSDVALKIAHGLAPQLKEQEVAKLYSELELPLLEVLSQMECTGIKVDSAKLYSISNEFSARLLKIEESAYDMIGERINLASPKQLAHHFFEKLGYPIIKKTKTGPSTDQSVLEALSRDYELPKVILEHRMLSKLKSTYVDALQRDVNPKTGRIHTSYNQSGTATGRLSSTNPNLQNIPIRTDDGKRIRASFVPKEGHTLIAGDYSQIELRLLAHLCEDDGFIEAFVRGEDIHSRTAQEILTEGEPPDQEARRKAKAINFGIIYGLSGFGLSRQLEIPRAEANEYIKMYFARYPKIRNFLDTCIADATSLGYATTLAGRRRYIPNLESKNKNLRQAGERIAMNTPIQGSAADLIKMAMLKVHARLEKERFATKMLLQVHDELVLEAPLEEKDAAIKLLREEMTGVFELKVPLVVDIGTGSSWAEAH